MAGSGMTQAYRHPVITPDEYLLIQAKRSSLPSSQKYVYVIQAVSENFMLENLAPYLKCDFSRNLCGSSSIVGCSIGWFVRRADFDAPSMKLLNKGVWVEPYKINIPGYIIVAVEVEATSHDELVAITDQLARILSRKKGVVSLRFDTINSKTAASSRCAFLKNIRDTARLISLNQDKKTYQSKFPPSTDCRLYDHIDKYYFTTTITSIVSDIDEAKNVEVGHASTSASKPSSIGAAANTSASIGAAANTSASIGASASKPAASKPAASKPVASTLHQDINFSAFKAYVAFMRTLNKDYDDPDRVIQGLTELCNVVDPLVYS